MQLELSPKSALYGAINGLERLYSKGAGASQIPLAHPAHVNLALRIAQACAVVNQWATAFVSETFSPDQAALHLIALQAGVSLKRIAYHQTKESDFTRLVEAAGRLSSAPLFLLRDDSSQFRMTTETLTELTRTGKIKAVINERSRIESSISWRERLVALSCVSDLRIYVLAGTSTAKAKHEGSPLE